MDGMGIGGVCIRGGHIPLDFSGARIGYVLFGSWRRPLHFLLCGWIGAAKTVCGEALRMLSLTRKKYASELRVDAAMLLRWSCSLEQVYMDESVG